MVVALNNNLPWGGLSSGHGLYYVVLQNSNSTGTSSLQQDLVGLVPGKRYTLSVRTALRPGYPSASLNVSLVTDGTTLVNARVVPTNNNFTK